MVVVNVGSREANDSGETSNDAMTYAEALFIITCLGIAIYNVVEIFVRIFTTFKKRRGLFFWSFIIATAGIALHAFGFFLRNYNITSRSIDLFPLILVTIGSIAMVSGQSVVLYSRLHLLSRTRKRSRWLLLMIVCDGVVIHTSSTVLWYCTNSAHPEKYIKPYAIVERINVLGFFLQETILSGLYIHRAVQTIKNINFEGVAAGRRPRAFLRHIILINAIVILLDISIVALEFAGLFTVQTSWKTLVYSVKLKLEFNMLSRLVELANPNTSANSEYGASTPALRYGNPGFSARRRSMGGTRGSALNTMGNSTYIRMEDRSSAVKLSDMDSSVVKTTEVIVQSSDVSVETIPVASANSILEDKEQTDNQKMRWDGEEDSQTMRPKQCHFGSIVDPAMKNEGL